MKKKNQIMIDSSSTDCVSSEEASSNNELDIKNSESNFKKIAYKLYSSRKLDKKCSIPNKFINKTHKENKKMINLTNLKINLSSTKSTQNIHKFLSDHLLIRNKDFEKADILLSNSINNQSIHIKREIDFSYNSDPYPHKNEFILKQKIRDDIEGSIMSLFREKTKQSQQINFIRDSISSIVNENKKISLMHQRYIIQSNSLSHEIKSLKEELIKVKINIFNQLG